MIKNFVVVFLFFIICSCANLNFNQQRFYKEYDTPAMKYYVGKDTLFVHNKFDDGVIKLELKFINNNINIIKFVEPNETVKIKIEKMPICIIFDEFLLYDYDNDYYNFGRICFK